MTEQDGFEEVVVLFNAESTGIEAEMRAEDFEALIKGSGGLEQFAASVVRAAFAVVGAALSLRGLVFFTFKVDEEGRVDASFNLPLRYLVDNAGLGPDLGTGAVRLACRGQCPVPWHSVNLWEPKDDAEGGSIQLVQKVIWRNRLGLRPSGAFDLRVSDALVLTDSRGEHRELEARLTETFGEQGKVNLENLIRQHNERLSEVSRKYRSEIEEQQLGYLNQIKTCRREIQELKAELRNEQQRSRRLQALLRGDP